MHSPNSEPTPDRATRAVIISVGGVITLSIAGMMIVAARDDTRTPAPPDASICESGIQFAYQDAAAGITQPDTAEHVEALFQASGDTSTDIRDALRDWSEGYAAADSSAVSSAAQDFIDECQIAGAIT
jgi:hypothetical protein